MSTNRGGYDALLHACRLVGEALGIEIRASSAMRQGRTVRDPISDIAFASRVQVRPVRLRNDWWRRDNGPLLAFVEGDGEQLHPVALLQRTPTSYEAVNAVTGERFRVNAETERAFHRQAFMFYPTLPARVLTGIDLLQFGAGRIWLRDVMSLVVMGLLAGALGMMIPIVTGDLFDRIIPQADVMQIWPVALLLAASAFGTLLFEFTRGVAMLRIEGRLESAMQSVIWDRVVNLPATFFRNYTAGDLAMRAMGIETIRQQLSGVAITTILSGVFSVFNFGLLFYYDRRLAAIATAILVVSMLLTLGLGYLSIRYQRILADLQGRLSSLVLQLINGITKFRMAGAEERAFYLWATQFSRQRQLT